MTEACSLVTLSLVILTTPLLSIYFYSYLIIVFLFLLLPSTLPYYFFHILASLFAFLNLLSIYHGQYLVPYFVRELLEGARRELTDLVSAVGYELPRVYTDLHCDLTDVVLVRTPRVFLC